MKINYFQEQKGLMIKVDSEIPPSEWHTKPLWVDIRANQTEEVVSFFQKNKMYPEAIEYIQYPSNYKSSLRLNGTKVFNLPISSSLNIYQPQYITIIAEKNCFISIIPEDFNAAIESYFSKNLKLNYSELVEKFSSNLVSDLIIQNNENARIARNRVHDIEEKLISNPTNLKSLELVTCETEIGSLADIFEDQFLSFGILNSIGNKNVNPSSKSKSKDFIQGIEPLIKAMDRLEKKTESLRLQFLLFQQERSAKKINTLTIIQAIFVPLTFISGVYGMNFVNIPELKYQYAYYICLAVFVGIASALLAYFHKNGWFD